MSTESPFDRSYPADRLTFFSDGVMAVAITVLVLALKLPEGSSPASLYAGLAALAHPFWCYVLSFIVIGVLWMAHHAQFANIRRVDAVVVWMNLFFLMSVVLIPFVTSILSDFDGPLPTVLYALVLMVSCLLLAAIWGYACARTGLVRSDVSRQLRRIGVISPLLVATVFAASIPIAYGYGATPAQWSWLVAALAGPIGDRLSRA